jgi:hypothetical protein
MTPTTDLTVKIGLNEKGNPPGKLADAGLHFTAGPLDGLKLIGFAVWERRGATGYNATLPRQYSVNGERRSFAQLRPLVDTSVPNGVPDLIVQADAEAEAATM